MTNTKPSDDTSSPSRLCLTADHRGYAIHATASRRITGAVLVNAELSGGPDNIRRWFCVASEHQDLTTACEQSIRELCQVIDDLLVARDQR